MEWQRAFRNHSNETNNQKAFCVVEFLLQISWTRKMEIIIAISWIGWMFSLCKRKLLQQINRASPTDITSHWEQLISICKFCIKRCYCRSRFTSLIPLNAKNQNVCIRLSWEAWENASKNCVRISLHTLDLTLAKKFQHFEEFVRQ